MQPKPMSNKQRMLELDDIKTVMSTKTGRRVMYRMLEKAGVFRLSYAGSTNETMFNEGRRNQGLFLTSEIQAACPGSYFEMMKENTDVN